MELYKTDLVLTHFHLRGKLNFSRGKVCSTASTWKETKTSMFGKPDEYIFFMTLRIIRLVKNKSQSLSRKKQKSPIDDVNPRNPPTKKILFTV